jgi:hypothetical protein
MQHIERHFSGSDTVRDVVIGMADGLTVPFALAAGISGALTSTHIVVTAGLAEITSSPNSLPEVAAGGVASDRTASLHAALTGFQPAEAMARPWAQSQSKWLGSICSQAPKRILPAGRRLVYTGPQRVFPGNRYKPRGDNGLRGFWRAFRWRIGVSLRAVAGFEDEHTVCMW